MGAMTTQDQKLKQIIGRVAFGHQPLYQKFKENKMDMKSISQKLQDDIRSIMEAGLHPNQQKINVHEPEKDEITADDFKKLRAMKKDQNGKITKEDTDDQIQELTGMAAQQAAVAISLIKAGKKKGTMPKPMREEEKKVVSPFDYKNYKSEIPKKPGELTGHDSKKISTGTVYTKKPVKEEVEQMDELSTSTLKSYISGAQKDRASQTDSKNSGDREEANYAKKQIVKRTSGIVDAKSRLNKEEVSQVDETKGAPKGFHFTSDGKLKRGDADRDGNGGPMLRTDPLDKQRNKIPKVSEEHEAEQLEYTFADYLEAARAQYVDEDAVLVANEAFKNQDITLFNYQSQSPEA